jgi:hypothetical protein
MAERAVTLRVDNRHRAMLERQDRYAVYLHGEYFGELSFNMTGYIGYLPYPGGHRIGIREQSISGVRREVADCNRAFALAALRAALPAIVDVRTGEERKDHTHARCAEGPDSERGHDHYCSIVNDSCDEHTCFGERDGSMDLRDEAFVVGRPSTASEAVRA